MMELQLGLSGRTLVFPDGRPICLVCGRPPCARRTAALKDVAYAARRSAGLNTLLERVHPALAWVNQERHVRFKIEVPVCRRHLLRGRWADLGVILASMLLWGAAAWAALQGWVEPKSVGAGFLKMGLMLLPVATAWTAWRFRSRSPLLPCTVRREAADRVVLVYEGDGLKR